MSRPVVAPRQRLESIADATGDNATTRWFMAVLFLVFAAVAYWYFRPPLSLDFSARDFNPFVLVPLAFAMIGAWNLVPAIRGTLTSRKFGDARFEMEGDSVRLGETLRGRIRTRTDLAPTADFVVTIACVERITRTSQMDNKQTTTDHTRWEAMRKWPAASVRSSQGIPVEFALPPTAFAIDDPRAEGVVRWILEAKAPLPGTDFAVIFPVDVRSAARSGPA
jgi:hypothetical protein